MALLADLAGWAAGHHGNLLPTDKVSLGLRTKEMEKKTFHILVWEKGGAKQKLVLLYVCVVSRLLSYVRTHTVTKGEKYPHHKCIVWLVIRM